MISTRLLVGGALCAAVVWPARIQASTEHEPNDTPRHAQGPIGADGLTTRNSTGHDDDYFYFRIRKARTVTITVTNLNGRCIDRSSNRGGPDFVRTATRAGQEKYFEELPNRTGASQIVRVGPYPSATIIAGDHYTNGARGCALRIRAAPASALETVRLTSDVAAVRRAAAAGL